MFSLGREALRQIDQVRDNVARLTEVMERTLEVMQTYRGSLEDHERRIESIEMELRGRGNDEGAT